MPQVKAWEACALSLDIDPHIMPHPRNYMAAGPGIDQIFKDESYRSEDEKKDQKINLDLLICVKT